jgi:poly(3-hydroxybutyrate) depolymerase
LGAEERRAIPIIIFHGDRDATVSVRNSGAIVEQILAGRELQRQASDDALAGRTYQRACYSDASGVPVIEQWTLRGAGHAWSGGNAAGSFTDARGPDASAEMVRFFLAQAAAGVR